jgi:DNA topoisomerase III
MPKTLVICEKPSVARDLVAALPGRFAESNDLFESDTYVIGFAVGHLVEQVDPDEYDAKYKRWKFEDLPIVPDEFRYEPRDAKAGKQLKSLHAAMRRKDIDELVNACDAGREGELIFKLILQTAKVEKPVRRAWFSSMTKSAIADAFESLRDDAELRPLEDAARSRSEADWLIGMNATRAATTRIGSPRSTISLGRVQTPTLALIVHRDLEIAAFVPEDYWQVQAQFDTAANERYVGMLQQGSSNRLKTAEEAARIASSANGADAVVESVERKPLVEQPPLLYDLTTLQREANQRFGFTAKRTLAAAQGCYERHKVLTYPRTSSRYISSDLVPTLAGVVARVAAADPTYEKAAAAISGLQVLPSARAVNDAKVGDHHAIIPTDEAHQLAGLSSDERRIYDLVARRFLAVFHPASESEQTVVWTAVGEDRFRSRGKVLLVAGWRAAYGEEALPAADDAKPDEDAEQRLPKLTEGQAVRCVEAEALAKQTKPPARYNESSLLRAMETAGKLVEDDEAAEAMKDSGLGTPATRAATIERLIDALYLEREGKQLRATAKAIGIITTLGDHELASPALTGEWERRLLRIEAGEESRDIFMRDIRTFTEETVAWFSDKDRSAMRVERRVVGPCPRCDGEIVERPKSYSCTSWKSKADPGCGYTLWKEVGGRTITFEEAQEYVAKGISADDIKVERVVIGACPTPGCGGEIIERTKSYGCTSWKSRSETGCGFVIWRKAGGKEVTREEAVEMVREGRTNATARPAAEPLGPCPNGDGDIVEKARSYGCTSYKSKKSPGCGFVIWKTQRGLGREIGREEAVEMVKEGITSPPAKADESEAA